MKKLAVIALGLLLFSCTKISDFQPGTLGNNGVETSSDRENGGFPVIPNELLIQFKDGVTETQRGNALHALGASVKELIHTNAMKHAGRKEGIYLIQSNINALEARMKLISNESVEFVEPNYIYQHTALPSDINIFNLWGLTTTYGIGAPTAWNTQTGNKSIYVGIIDEGVMNTHEDLATNMGTNPKEIVNKRDDDGNGLVDDIYGWDFVRNDNTIYDGTADDHGTHVAGTIGAIGNNGKGVVGVNWAISILNAKFLGTNGGSTANAIKAVDYFTDLKTRANINIVATNNSWGGGGYSQGLRDAIQRAGDKGILFIAAAGNNTSNMDVVASYPASYKLDNMISVAAIDQSGNIASFSNYGATTVDIAAPGVGINSTVPSSSRKTGWYASYNGTSMATPHVTGACALYAAKYPASTAAQIKAAILANAIATPSISTKVVDGKRLNVSSF